MGAGSAGIMIMNYFFVLILIVLMSINLRSFHLFYCDEPEIKKVYLTEQGGVIGAELAFCILGLLLIIGSARVIITRGFSIGITNTIFSGLLVIGGIILYIMSNNEYDKFEATCKKFNDEHKTNRTERHQTGKIIAIILGIITFLSFLGLGKSQT